MNELIFSYYRPAFPDNLQRTNGEPLLLEEQETPVIFFRQKQNQL